MAVLSLRLCAMEVKELKLAITHSLLPLTSLTRLHRPSL